MSIEKRTISALKKYATGSLTCEELAYYLGVLIMESYDEGGLNEVKVFIQRNLYFVRKAFATNEIMQGLYEKAEELDIYNDKANMIIGEISNIYNSVAA